MRLEGESMSSGSVLQGVCGLFHHKAAKGVRHQRENTAEMNQRTLHCG